MQWSPFLEMFVGLFLAIGAGVGWFTRIRVWIFVLAVAAIVFGSLVVISAQYPPAAPSLTTDDVYIAALLAVLAAVPVLVSCGITRYFKRRK